MNRNKNHEKTHTRERVRFERTVSTSHVQSPRQVDWNDIFDRIRESFAKLFVALRESVRQRLGLRPQPKLQLQRLPYFKMAVLGALAFLITREDLSFSVNLGGEPVAVEDAERHASEASFGQAANMSLKAEIPAAPFADLPGDTEKDRRYKQYIRRFAKTAQSESTKYGMPASINMAQGLLESGAGKSRLATKNNNHFGVKCFSKKCAKGHCSNFDDDHHKDFFRSYKSAWESWRAHSELLQRKHYRHLKKLDSSDYKAWAHGLKKAGYATDPRYAEKLIDLIETYGLHQLD